VHVDARSARPLSSPPMNLSSRLLPTASPLRLAAAALLLLAASRPAAAQNFAVGAGGVVVNDSSATKSVSAFGTGGFQIFGEVHLEKTTTFQLRLGSFTLPPSPSPDPTLGSGPNVTAAHIEMLAQYLFEWDWFQAGFIAGLGAVRMTPKSLQEGQVEVDVQENAFTLMGGVVTKFQLVPSVDLRLEADFYYFNSKADRVPVTLGLMAAYSF